MLLLIKGKTEADFNDVSTFTGILKDSKRVGESTKENVRASSIIRPRAVLSSPGNCYYWENASLT